MRSKDSSSVRTIVISEPVLNSSQLPEFENIKAIQQLDIQFMRHVVFNSIGIRAWISWLKPLADRADVLICLHECPVSVVHQINTVHNFLPKNAEVVSFMAPFFSEETDEVQQYLMIKGHNFFEDKVHLPELFDSKKKPMALDAHSTRYFSFLKRQKK